ncbi:MAG: DUF2255 family protein [Anaerolineales bacterium]
MTVWASEEINKIGTAEELEIQSLRGDGTLRNAVTIWVVRAGDDLYVRSRGVSQQVPPPPRKLRRPDGGTGGAGRDDQTGAALNKSLLT